MASFEPGDVITITKPSDDWTNDDIEWEDNFSRFTGSTQLVANVDDDSTLQIKDGSGNWFHFDWCTKIGHHYIPFASGTKARYVGPTGSPYWTPGNIYEVKSPADNDGDVKLWTEDKSNWHYCKATKLEEIIGENNMSNTSSNPVKALFEVDLDADTKTLRQFDFENSDGTRTQRAVDAMLNAMWKQQRASFAKQLRDLEAAEDAKTEAE